MKVQELLDIQEAITKRGTPSDMRDEELNKHFSTSKKEWINLLDMDILHLIRSYSKCLDKKIQEDNEYFTFKGKILAIESKVNELKDIVIDKS